MVPGRTIFIVTCSLFYRKLGILKRTYINVLVRRFLIHRFQVEIILAPNFILQHWCVVLYLTNTVLFIAGLRFFKQGNEQEKKVF